MSRGAHLISRTHPDPRARLLVAGALVVALCAGCGSTTGPIEVARPAGAADPACARLIAALPATVDDRPSVPTSGSGYSAAWGKPAIVLRCGVGRPAGYTRTAECSVIDGIGWFLPHGQVLDPGTDITATTLFRAPGIEVVVPASYRPQGPGNALVDLAGAVRAQTRAHKHCA